MERAWKQNLPERKTPGFLRNAPQLLPWLDEYLDAFGELDSARAMNGRIPWTAIDAYAYRYDFVGEEFDTLVFFIRQMDVEALEHDKKQREKPKDGGQQPGGIQPKNKTLGKRS